MSVDKIVAQYDVLTGAALRSRSAAPTLAVHGDPESPFLRAVTRKCERFGVEVALNQACGLPTVVDRETAELGDALPAQHDVDCMDNPGMSCCAQALLSIITDRLNRLAGSSVCIVGRGHAVKGLAEELLANGATVSVCHSKTRQGAILTAAADAVVLASPELPSWWEPLAAEKKTIDVSGAVGSGAAVSAAEVGRVTVSVLLHRLAGM